MGKYKYSETEQKTVNVLKYQDNQLDKLLEDSENRSVKREKEIAKMEAKLLELGIDPATAVVKKESVAPKKLMVVPSLDSLCKEAEAAVGNSCELESIFTPEELKSNELAVKQLNAEYNQLHKLDKIDIAISAIAGIIGAAVDILLVGIP